MNQYSDEIKHIIEYLFGSQHLDQKQTSLFKYYAMTKIILRGIKIDMSYVERESVLLHLIENSFLNERQKKVLQYCLIKINPNAIPNDEAANIYKYIGEGDFFLPLCNNFPDIVFINPREANILLVKMRLNNLTNIISDEDAIAILNKFNYLYEENEKAELLEQFYLQNRSQECGTLTIANNTKQLLHYKIKLCANETEEFQLNSGDRKYYKNLRNKNILYIGIIISQNNKKLFDFAFIDANSYIACYGSNEIKFSVYFEPDASKEKMEPTEQMILQVAKILRQEYEKQKKYYASLDIPSFIKGLGCDEIGIENQCSHFTRLLNGLMRPKQLEKAIKQILGD